MQDCVTCNNLLKQKLQKKITPFSNVNLRFWWKKLLISKIYFGFFHFNKMSSQENLRLAVYIFAVTELKNIIKKLTYTENPDINKLYIFVSRLNFLSKPKCYEQFLYKQHRQTDFHVHERWWKDTVFHILRNYCSISLGIKNIVSARHLRFTIFLSVVFYKV